MNKTNSTSTDDPMTLFLAFKKVYEYWTHVTVLGGIVLNAVLIVLMLKKRKPRNAWRHLTIVASADVMFSIMLGVNVLQKYFPSIIDNSVALCKLSMWIFYSSSTISTYTWLYMSAERYATLTHWRLSQLRSLNRYQIIAEVCIVIFCFVCESWTLATFSVINNQCQTVLDYNAVKKVNLAESLIAYFLPFTLLILINIQLTRYIAQWQSTHVNLSRRSSSYNNFYNNNSSNNSRRSSATPSAILALQQQQQQQQPLILNANIIKPLILNASINTSSSGNVIKDNLLSLSTRIYHSTSSGGRTTNNDVTTATVSPQPPHLYQPRNSMRGSVSLQQFHQLNGCNANNTTTLNNANTNNNGCCDEIRIHVHTSNAMLRRRTRVLQRIICYACVDFMLNLPHQSARLYASFNPAHARQLGVTFYYILFCCFALYSSQFVLNSLHIYCFLYGCNMPTRTY